MLKFWKNTARGKSKFPTRPPESFEESTSPSSSVKNFDASQTPAYNFESFLDAADQEDNLNYSSRLSQTFQEVLSNKNSLSYFMQYLDSKTCMSLIQFWLEVENFKTATKSFHMTDKSNDTAKTLHQNVNRTVSFDSSIAVNGEVKHKCLSNGFSEPSNNYINHSQINKILSRSALRVASCSNISSSDVNISKNDVSSKKSLLDDAIRIFKKFIALESPQRLDIPEDIRNMIVSSICHPEGLIDPDIFKVVQNIVYERMSAQHFESFIQSAYYCKYKIDILTNGTLTIEDIIYNQMVLFYFMEYIEQEQSSSLLEFVIAVINFREQLQNNTNTDLEQAQNDAIILYDKYFSLQATSSLGFPGEVRLNIEENICVEGGPFPDCFHLPFRLALKVLQQYISTFLTSQLYYKYLSDMIGCLDDGWQSTTRHKKSASDCSSEISISAKNTLLAMEDFPSYSRKHRNDQTMRIDSKLLYNGDLLWRRKSNKGLSLGRVNSLGRFESCMEPEPEKKDSSVLKRVVNKLVSGEKDKAKEELAWQVAHMIVKDITDITMGIPENSL